MNDARCGLRRTLLLSNRWIELETSSSSSARAAPQKFLGVAAHLGLQPAICVPSLLEPSGVFFEGTVPDLSLQLGVLAQQAEASDDQALIEYFRKMRDENRRAERAERVSAQQLPEKKFLPK